MAFLLSEAICFSHKTWIFKVILGVASVARVTSQVLGGCASVRGENMQIFLSLHGRTLTKAAPDSPIQACDGFWPLSHATVVFAPGLPGGAIGALSLPIPSKMLSSMQCCSSKSALILEWNIGKLLSYLSPVQVKTFPAVFCTKLKCSLYSVSFSCSCQ